MGFNYEYDPISQISGMIDDFDAIRDKIPEAMEDAVDASAKIILESQKRLVPVKTGVLKRSLARYFKKKDGKVMEYIGVDFGKYPEVRGRAVSNEFGRRGGTSKSGKRIAPMRASPYIRAGFDASAESAAQKAAEVFLDKVGFNK